MVIQSNPFRYKIVRVSEPLPWERRKTSEGFNNLYCEVFDSDTYAWKRLNDLELRSDEFLRRSEKPESSYGLLHWLTGKNNVIQFCMQTETWSFFPLPEDVIGDGSSLDLVSYEGKLAVLCSNSNSRGGYDLWALDNSSGKSWANVKDVQVTDLEDKYAKPLWFLSNDVILVAGFVRLGLYNTNSNKFQYLHKTTQECLPYYLPRDTLRAQTNPQGEVQPTDRLSLRVFKWTLMHRPISVWVTWMGSSPPPGVEPVSMTIGPQGPSPSGLPHPVYFFIF
ncbi:hypothetical protein Bca101_038875 [Brassica carinata]